MRRLLSVLPLLPALACAGPADLDRNFGADGRALVDYGNAPASRFYPLIDIGATQDGGLTLLEAAMLPDGLNANIARLRLDERGHPRDLRDLGIPAIFIRDAIVYPDGSFLLLSTASANDLFGVRLLKFRPDATLDPAFGGGDGTVEFFDATGYVLPAAMAVAADGSIAATGFFEPGFTQSNVAARQTFVARVTAAGVPIAGFGSMGFVRHDIAPGQADSQSAVAVTPGGKVLVCMQGDYGAQIDATLTRLRLSGAIDTFGAAGTTYYDSSTPQENRDDVCADLDIDPQTGAAVMTVVHSGQQPGVRRVLVDEDGNYAPTPDTLTLPNFPQATLQFAPDGSSVITALYRGAGNVPELMFTKFLPSGIKDVGFGILGVQRHAPALPAEVDPGTLIASTPRAALDARGRLLAAVSVRHDAAVAAGVGVLRLFNEVPFSNGFE